MSRRDAQHRHSPRSSYLDPEEIHESEPTRAARPPGVSPEDLVDLVVFSADPDAETRSPRASYVASRELEPFARDSSENPTRSARESYVALSELPQMPVYARAQGFAEERTDAHAMCAGEAYADEVVEDEVTSFVDRSSDEQRADGPDSVTTFAVRPSYVAHDELHNEGDAYASSEIEQLATSEERLSYATSEFEEVDEAGAAEPFDFAPPIPSGSIQSGPVDYEALSRYLFDDVPHPTAQLLPPPPAGHADILAPEALPASYPRQPAACVRQPMPSRPPTDETPVQPLMLASAMATHRSRMPMNDAAPEPTPYVPSAPMRRPMHSIHPDHVAAMQHSVRRSMHSVHPQDVAAPVHSVHPHAIVVPMQSMRRSMPSMHPHDVAAPMQSMRRSMPSMHPHDVAAPMQSMRRSMPSMHPHDVAAPMQSMRRSMPSMHPHDSSAESPWIVTMSPSSSRRGVPLARPAPFKVTASFVAAAMIALLAVGVMVAGVLFVHSDDSTSAKGAPLRVVGARAPNSDDVRSTASAAQLDFPSPAAAPTDPALPPVARPTTITITAPEDAQTAIAPAALASTAAAPVPPSAAAAAAVQIGAAPQGAAATPAQVGAASPGVAAAKPASIAAAPKPLTPGVVPPAPQTVARSTSPAAPARKADAKSGEKSVEDILSELGEEQLRR